MTQRHYVIIIGAMKSGTTTLFDMLARHPEIAPAADKEPGFFAFDPIWEKGFDWFDTLFDFDPATQRYRMEASTDYTKAPFVRGVWDRMTASPNVSAKLIYIMRHPLRRLESHARHVQSARMEIGREITGQPDHSLNAGLSPVNLAVSAYARQLDVYDAARQAGDLLCLTLEELKTEPEATLARVFAFLDLDPARAESGLLVSNAADTLTRQHPAWGHIARFRPLIAAGKALLPENTRQSIKGAFRQKVTAEGRFTLSAEEAELLTHLYAGDMARLREIYGIDTRAHWEL